MRNRLVFTLMLLLAPAMAQAQIHQVSSSSSDGNSTIQFNIGYFALKALDSRVNDDVLVTELLNPPVVIDTAQPLLFEVKDFNSVSFGGEYLLGFAEVFEAGVGLGYYQRTVPSVYAHLTHPNGDEIAQDLKLRTIPVTFTVRFLPLGRRGAVEPYIGGGLAAISWRYSEVGEFVDTLDASTFPARYEAKGTATGPTVLGGLRGVVDRWTVGGEVRWQKAEGTIPVDSGLIGNKFDLGGWTTNFTLGVRF
jgi:hypothetical protein